MQLIQWTIGDLNPEKGRREPNEYIALFRFDSMDEQRLDKNTMDEIKAQYEPNPYLNPSIVSSIQINEKDIELYKEKVVTLFARLMSYNIKV